MNNSHVKWPIPILLQTDDLPYDTELSLVFGDSVVGSLRFSEAYRIPLRDWAKTLPDGT